MNKKLLVALGAIAPLAASADIFISEYIEGSSYNKAIELYNPDQNSIDLSEYTIKLYQNGASEPTYTIDLSGQIASESTFVIAHNDIDPNAIVNYSVGNLLHNGDDAIVLEKNNIVIDRIGEIGVDPGSSWSNGGVSTKDKTLVRKPNINQGDVAATSSFDPSEQWLAFDRNTVSYLGSHAFSGETPTDDGNGNGNGNGDGDGNNNGDPLLCNSDFTAIDAIQGTGASSPIVGQQVTIEAVVTASYQETGYGGYFVQSGNNENDERTETSQGLFIADSENNVNVGDRVRLSGTVTEYNSLTELTQVSQFQVCASDVELPTATAITLPATTEQRESFEGMLVTLTQPLFVTDTYNYGRYGQIGLATERLFNPTQIASPGEAAQQVVLDNQNKQIVLDDGQTNQNPDLLPFPAPELDAQNTLRSGDKATAITGVLTYAFSQYQLMATMPVNFEHVNARTPEPVVSERGDLRVASFNVLNYFNGDGFGSGYPTARGAKTAEEFERQRTKIVSAIVSLDADIIGLMEIENDGYGSNSAIADLVQGINDIVGEAQYQYIAPSAGQLGTDAIAVGLLYRATTVLPLNDANVLSSSNSITDEQAQPLFLDSKNRPMLTQQFHHIAADKNLVVAVNHLKSKGSNCDSLQDYDLQDGQGNCNTTRTRAAQAMGAFLQQHYQDVPTLIIGDLNAYAKEDPLSQLAEQGYRDVFVEKNKQGAYSYIFKGELGQLDHALANNSLLENIVDVATWPINVDEPRVLDYSTQYQSAAQHAKFYAPDAYRSSDHDPIVVEINLADSTMFGDFDGDEDIDKNDVALFITAISQQTITDMAYDFNQDNTISRRDVRGLMQLCTRSRCATE